MASSISAKLDVSLDDGITYVDANLASSSAVVPSLGIPFLYRVTITNNGNEDLDDVSFEVEELGIRHWYIGQMEAGEVRIFTHEDLVRLKRWGTCPGTFVEEKIVVVCLNEPFMYKANIDETNECVAAALNQCKLTWEIDWIPEGQAGPAPLVQIDGRGLVVTNKAVDGSHISVSQGVLNAILTLDCIIHPDSEEEESPCNITSSEAIQLIIISPVGYSSISGGCDPCPFPQNGGFELGTDEYWQLSEGRLVTSPTNSGSYAYLMTNSSGSAYTTLGQKKELVFCNADQANFTLSFYASTNGDTNGIILAFIHWYTNDGYSEQYSEEVTIWGDGFNLYEISRSIPTWEDVIALRVYFVAEEGSHHIVIDDISTSLCPKCPDPCPFPENGSFELGNALYWNDNGGLASNLVTSPTHSGSYAYQMTNSHGFGPTVLGQYKEMCFTSAQQADNFRLTFYATNNGGTTGTITMVIQWFTQLTSGQYQVPVDVWQDTFQRFDISTTVPDWQDITAMKISLIADENSQHLIVDDISTSLCEV